MLIAIAIARLATEVFSIEQLLKLAGEAAQWAERFPSFDRRSPDEWAEIADLLANRASRLVPGAQCLQRALASRVWLARRGIDAQIVVGFRKRGTLEGHAWLELQLSGGPSTLFKGFEDGYRESFREAAA
ncbi:lasso peptide biosynthesis B2 protein [Persicimonas caeni]|nr:lasso peptide biosynthesis B2 protein [Persicimonas caeni]